MDSLNEITRLENRSVSSTRWPDPSAPDRPLAAEVVHVSAGQRHQFTRTRSQFFRLSVTVVDYLLEHEWFSLLAGHRRHPSGKRGHRYKRRGDARRASSNDLSDPTVESNRTACVSESPWSIVAAIEQAPPPDSTSTTE